MLPFASKSSDSIAIFTNTRVPAASECGNSRKHPCKLSSLTRVLCGRILRSNFGAGVKRKCPTWGPQDSSSLIVDFAACRNEQKTVRLGCCNSHQILGTLYDLPYPCKLINYGINTNGGRQGLA